MWAEVNPRTSLDLYLLAHESLSRDAILAQASQTAFPPSNSFSSWEDRQCVILRAGTLDLILAVCYHAVQLLALADLVEDAADEACDAG